MAVKGDFKEFGEYVRNLRKTSGLSQLDVSAKLGTDYNISHAIEAGILKPTEKVTNQLADLFKVDAHAFDIFLKKKRKSIKAKEGGSESDFYIEIGKRIKEAREKVIGLKPIEMAELLGIQRNHYAYIEKGESKPNLIHTQKIAKRLFPQYPESSAIMYILYGKPLGKTAATRKMQEEEFRFLKDERVPQLLEEAEEKNKRIAELEQELESLKGKGKKKGA